MRQGVVKWFNETKGYGFIQPSEGGSDIYVHHSVIESTGFKVLSEGQPVEFESIESPKGLQATKCRPI